MKKSISILQKNHSKGTSKVIRAELKFSEDKEIHVPSLRDAIKEGLNSGIATDFDPYKHLNSLKEKKENI